MEVYLLLLLQLAAATNGYFRKAYGHIPKGGEGPSPGEIALNFKKDNNLSCYYPEDQIRIFDTISNALEDTKGDDYPIDVPDFISKEDFDTILNIFENGPAIRMMDAERFAHTLRMADYLGIGDDYILNFFSCVCKHSILGTHGNDILSTRLYGKFESSVEQGGIIYTHLARGLANALGLQVGVLEEGGQTDLTRTLVFHTPLCRYVKKHKGKVLDFSARITKVKITSIAQDKAAADPLGIIIWLFEHIKATCLDLFGCYVDKHIIAKIAYLERLEVLGLGNCSVRRGSLVPIGKSPTLQGTLRGLYLSYNKHLGLKDINAIASLAALKVLYLSRCKLSSGSLVHICKSPTLQETLRELYLSHNKRLSLKDTKAIALLTVLEALDLSCCKLSSGSLVPIGKSLTLQETLCRLYLSHSKRLSLKDARAIALLNSLQALDLGHCKLPSGVLALICNSSRSRTILRELYLFENERLSPEDMGAVALLTNLEVLNLSCCSLQPGSLVPIGNSPTLRKTLHELYLSGNDNLDHENINAIASLTVLQVLKLRSCSLRPGSLVRICDNLKVLRELHLSNNEHLGLENINAIAALTTLQVLNISSCSLRPGSLIPIGNNPALQKILRELHASNSEFSLGDIKAAALLTSLRVLKLGGGCTLPPGSLVPIYNGLILSGILRELDVTNTQSFDSEDKKIIAESRNLIYVLG